MKVGDLVMVRRPEINSQMLIWHQWMGHFGVVVGKNQDQHHWPIFRVLISSEVLDFDLGELEQMF